MGLFAAADIWFHHVAFQGNEELSEWLGMKVKREKQESCNGVEELEMIWHADVIGFITDKDLWRSVVHCDCLIVLILKGKNNWLKVSQKLTGLLKKREKLLQVIVLLPAVCSKNSQID